MFEHPAPGVGGTGMFMPEFGDIVTCFSPYTCSLFIFALIFTVLAIISKPEEQMDIIFGGDGYYRKHIPLNEMKFRRFMAIACGLATMGGMVTGDLFNYCLFTAMVGITNVGVVAAVRNNHVLNAAYQYGIVAMVATVPLFAGAAITLATTGTLSLFELGTLSVTMPFIAKILLLLGVLGEGMAPFYAAKAEMFRAPGAPYVIMIHVSSLLIFMRVAEILITV